MGESGLVTAMAPDVFAARRRVLSARVGVPILLSGNDERARNLPMNRVAFRQDSSFLYYTGVPLPQSALVLEGDRAVLYRPTQDPRDVLWHGDLPSWDSLQQAWGVDEVRDISRLEADVRALQPLTLAVADEAVNRRVSSWTGKRLSLGEEIGDEALADAVIAQRRPKAPEELSAMRSVGRLTGLAHRAAMAATKPGGHEAVLTAFFEALFSAARHTLGYTTILTQQGEVLHHHGHEGVLTSGRLLLLDGGAEAPSGYGADVTRTWPVSGRYTPRQKGAYEAVLEAQLASIALCTPGVRYRDVHMASARVLAQFLVDERLLRCDVDTVVERHAHALFFPHGVGHHLGLDVHDLENFGDRPAYPAGQARDRHFGTAYLRLDLPLEANWVVTVEPGFYVVPSIFRDAELMAEFGDIVDVDRIGEWLGFGGIRIEDDVVVGADPEVLTATAPKTVADVESTVGTGVAPEQFLCGA